MRIIDTEDKILSGDNHPQLKIGNKLYTVDDRKKTWDKIQAVQDDDSVADKDKEILNLALGEKETEEILANDLTVEGFANLTFYIMAAITGEDFDDLKKAASERKN